MKVLLLCCSSVTNTYDYGIHVSVCRCFIVTLAQIISPLNYMAAYSMFPRVVFVYMCTLVLHFVCMCVCVVGVIGDSGLITTLMLFSQRPLKLPSTPSSQCVVARQPRVRCFRAALFVPYEWFARERKDGRRWGWEKEIHKLVNGRSSLEGPWINAWANNLCLSLSAAIFLSTSASLSRLAHSDLHSLIQHLINFCTILYYFICMLPTNKLIYLL